MTKQEKNRSPCPSYVQGVSFGTKVSSSFLFSCHQRSLENTGNSTVCFTSSRAFLQQSLCIEKLDFQLTSKWTIIRFGIRKRLKTGLSFTQLALARIFLWHYDCASKYILRPQDSPVSPKGPNLNTQKSKN